MNAIECHELGRRFGPVCAVDRLSFSVPAGSIFTLLGANGAGKTTTIHLLLGLLEPTSGHATVLGCDTKRDGGQIRRQAGALLEHHGLYERVSAYDNLEIYARIARIEAGSRAERIRELLIHFELWDRRNDRLGTWSRGMKQKLAIARALLHRPKILFLDEPTAGLDPEAVVSLRRDIATIAAEGTTVFLNTHNLADASKLSDRIGIMRAGRLVATGTAAELQARLGAPAFTIVASGLTPLIIAALEARADVDSVRATDERLEVRLRETTSVAGVVRDLVERGANIEEVRPERKDLEQLFLELVHVDQAGDDVP